MYHCNYILHCMTLLEPTQSVQVYLLVPLPIQRLEHCIQGTLHSLVGKGYVDFHTLNSRVSLYRVRHLQYGLGYMTLDLRKYVCGRVRGNQEH